MSVATRIGLCWPLFAVLAVTHIGLLAADASPASSITKCLAAPVLTWWIIASGGPRILALAFVFCFGGDLFLEIDGWFLPGMASFALAHVCFIAWFASRGAFNRLRARPWIAVALAVAALMLVGVVWSGIDDPVVAAVLPVYAALLSGTAATALVTNRLAGIGALMFLASDALIALTRFGRIEPHQWTSLTIMISYLAAIALLAAGGRAAATPGNLRRSEAPTPL